MVSMIVVPLDGSRLAEQALEPAQFLALRLHAAIEVVQVFVPAMPSMYGTGSPPIDSRLDAELREEAAAYIDDVAARERIPRGARVAAKLLEGPVVETLAAHLAALDHPLVVMMTHGRSGIGRVMLGSVTEALVRSATVPVLAIRARNEAEAAVAIRFGRVLVPIAGGDFGTDMGDRTADIFGTANVEYLLLHAVIPAPLIAPLDPAIPPPVPVADAEAEAARDLLDGLADRLRARGAQARVQVLIDVDSAHAILEAVNNASADVISMATHGYHGIKRLVLGSVAETVLRHATVPVLLVRPPEPGEPMHGEEAKRAAAR